MAVTIPFDATPGGASANSYVSLDDAETYFSKRLRATVWSGAASDDDKARALIMATADIDANARWDVSKTGWRTHSDGALEFPRVSVETRSGDAYYGSEVIPPFLVEMTCEQALAHLVGERTTDADARGVTSVKAGEVALSFDPAIAGARKTMTDRAIRAGDHWMLSSGEITPGMIQQVELVR